DLAPARGFRFWADGPEHLEMGAEADARCGFKLHVRLPRHADLRLLRNGVEIARTLRGTSLDVPADEPGAYRVEASLQDRGRLRTGSLSSPIYLRCRFRRRPVAAPARAAPARAAPARAAPARAAPARAAPARGARSPRARPPRPGTRLGRSG